VLARVQLFCWHATIHRCHPVVTTLVFHEDATL
jgi:hypothetical protein